MKTKPTFLIVLLVALYTSIYGSLEVRLVSTTPSSSHSNHFSVDIEVRSTNSPISLADQNYRLYYDADQLILDETSLISIMPRSQYGALVLTEHIRGIENDGSRSDLKGDLGFVNFSVELIDISKGGRLLSPSSTWTKVAQLEFKKLQNLDHYHLIWAEESTTTQYATAYIQMTKWLSSRSSTPLDIVCYHLSEQESKEASEHISVSIGPNPTSDIISVSFHAGASSDMIITITDMVGKKWISKDLREGDMTEVIDVSGLPVSSYTFEVIDLQGTSLFSERLAIVR